MVSFFKKKSSSEQIQSYKHRLSLTAPIIIMSDSTLGHFLSQQEVAVSLHPYFLNHPTSSHPFCHALTIKLPIYCSERNEEGRQIHYTSINQSDCNYAKKIYVYNVKKNDFLYLTKT